MTRLRITLAVLLAIVFGTTPTVSCSHREVEHRDLSADYDQLSRILDPALLSNDPLGALRDSLVLVRSLAFVDSAWIVDSTAFVKMSGGGIVSWTARAASPPGR